jgi:hypothetical protein
MNFSALRTVVVVAIVAGVAGCQSGPRWAWWKHKTATEDTSLVARSAIVEPPAVAPTTAPQLPSTQATPQAVAAAGMESLSPSSLNLANAANPGAALAPPLAGTMAAAPPPTYPYPSATTRAAATPATPPAPSAGLAQAGPYDPNAYQSSASLPTTTPATVAANDSPSVDRYGSVSASRYSTSAATTPVEVAAPPPTTPAPSTGNRYANAPDSNSLPPTAGSTMPSPGNAPSEAANGGLPPASSLMGGDRYGRTSGDRYAAAASAATTAATPDQYTPIGVASPATIAAPTSAGAISLATAAPAPPAMVKLASAPGQYRPGGTSTYAVGSTPTAIEVASRPAAPATTPSTSATPATGNWPTVPALPAAPAPPASRY